MTFEHTKYRKCIYCFQEKEESLFSLEHVIPQFLGGAYAPDQLKTRDVCTKCNSNLGLFVDASFEKNFLVYNTLRQSAYAFYSSRNQVGLPLRCLGITEFVPPGMLSDDVCEYWSGPLGEQVYWIRPNDSSMRHYLGGNPRTTKQVKTRAYFFASELTRTDPIKTWLSFRDAFAGRRVTKILCATVTGQNPKDIGFSDIDSLDERRIEYFRQEFDRNPERKLSVEISPDFDKRFIAKLAIGVAYTLFGHYVLTTPYMKELHGGLWFREGNTTPLVRGSTLVSGYGDEDFNRLSGIENAVTVTVAPNDGNIAIILNLSAKMHWVVMCAKAEELRAEDRQKVGKGICIVLFRCIQKGLSMTWPEFIAHKAEEQPHPTLVDIAKTANRL